MEVMVWDFCVVDLLINCGDSYLTYSKAFSGEAVSLTALAFQAHTKMTWHPYKQLCKESTHCWGKNLANEGELDSLDSSLLLKYP